MRQAFATRLVRGVTIALLALAGLFALLANVAGEGRVDEVLGLDADRERGETLYMEIANPTCASCHSLSDAGAESIIASDLDETQPSARVTVQSLIAGTTPEHDREGYRHELSNQDLADLARYIEAVAGP
ncbi:MAG: c-type cytochrome [Egibacteraceae bacterium]